MTVRFISVASIALLSTTAMAQETLPQSQSPWFTDAQSHIQDMVSRTQNTHRAKNVILFIGDGMGVNTNYAIRLYDGQKKGGMGDDNVLPYEAFPNLALVKTYNINAQTPDSAPTAGAMNTGVKQLFNTINISDKGVYEDCASVEGNQLETFAEMASAAGKSVGVVTTARITHATPAAVYAKTASRDWEASVPEGCTAQTDIAAQLLDSMKAGVIDFAMGGGRREFISKGTKVEEDVDGKRTDGKNLIDMARKAGFQYAWNTATANDLKLDGQTPVLGLFEGSHMHYEADRTEDDEPSLTEMTTKAIDYLKNNDEGYYLEIESGRIDHANHDGNAYRTLTDGEELARAVAMADEMTDDADTLIIVTADHGHSMAINGYCGRGTPILGLCYDINNKGVMHSDELVMGEDGKPYTVIGYMNGPGSIMKKKDDGSFEGARPDITEEQATDKDYLQQALIPKDSESHSGADVALYAKGPWSHLFDGTVEQNYIFHVMDYATKHDTVADTGAASTDDPKEMPSTAPAN